MFQISEVLKKVPFFRTLSKDGLSFIVERLRFKPFDANQVICRVGDPGDKMYIIINGSVDVIVEAPETGHKKVIATLKSGDYFGEMSLLTGEPRSATVVTREPSEMFILSKEDFDVIVERFPSISLSMGKIMSQRLRDTLRQAAQGSEGAPAALQGSLAQRSLEEVLRICEDNSLNGKVLVRHGEEQGEIELEKGVIQQVVLGDLPEDQAMDRMLSWREGEFVIQPRPLSLEDAQPVAESESRRIVIVNNSKVVQRLLQQALEREGFEVYAVETIGKGQNLVRSLNPAMVLVDTKLPDGSGAEFVTQVRNFSSLPVIVLADTDQAESIRQRLETTPAVYFPSSQEIPELLRLVRSILS
ncbi:MAG: response regulator [Calditrichaeota bacterium]|nr:MAG: response regulator [Calditrichota bacterium]